MWKSANHQNIDGKTRIGLPLREEYHNHSRGYDIVIMPCPEVLVLPVR